MIVQEGPKVLGNQLITKNILAKYTAIWKDQNKNIYTKDAYNI